MFQETRPTKMSNHRIPWQLQLDEHHWKMIEKVVNQEPVPLTAKELAEVSGLSRSATLKRAHELAQMGIFDKSNKPGTENRLYPPYIFSLAEKYKSEIIADLNKGQHSLSSHDRDLVSQEIKEKELSNLEEDRHLTEKERPLNEPSSEASFDQASKSISDDEYIQTSSLQEQDLKNLNSSEKHIGLILQKMAQEIASLRNRVTQLEKQLEDTKPSQISDTVDFDEVLSILESKPPIDSTS
ncbi:hypothetical protein [Cyanothece sp. BG0011]|uniref:hypothetical protein n=1 Tax=Cyanothece sp. BG0011 TaxID=2082950 RepID=UPI0013006D44|nr:hypothetical protein [Cyanothece sp. BG0011]